MVQLPACQLWSIHRHSRGTAVLTAWAELLPALCPPSEPCFEEGSSQSSFFSPPVSLAVLQGGESVLSFLVFEIKAILSNEENRLQNDKTLRRLRV